MSITITKFPQSIHPVESVNGIPVCASTTLTADTTQKFIFDLYVSNDDSTYTFANRNRITGNPTTKIARYNPAQTLINYVSHDFRPFTLVVTSCTNSFIYYRINYGEEFATFQEFYQTANNGGFVQLDFLATVTGITAGDSVIVKMETQAYNPQYQNIWTATSVSSNSIVLNCPYVSTPLTPETGYITRILHIQGGISSYTGYNGKKQYYDNDEDWEQRFNLTGTTSKFLTNFNVSGKKFKIREEEPATLSAIYTGFGTPNFKIKYRTYDENLTQIGEYDLAATTTDSKLRFDLPTGTWNLKRITETNLLNSNVEPIFSSNVKYYSVQVYRSTTQISQLANYQVVCTDNRYNPYRFAFLNEHGGIDYFTCDKKNYFTSKIRKEEFEQYLNADYQIGDRGVVTSNVDVEEITEIYTSFIDDSENVLIREMAKSKEVYYLSIGQQYYYPIHMEITDLTEKNSQNTNGLFTYKLKFKYAYPSV